MDEIICPECGRPTVEAEKCWYCQSPLVSKEDDSEELLETPAEQTGEASANNSSAATQEKEENLPKTAETHPRIEKSGHTYRRSGRVAAGKIISGIDPGA